MNKHYPYFFEFFNLFTILLLNLIIYNNYEENISSRLSL